MKLSIIVAVSENGVIGYHGDMPWKKLPSDLKFFKSKTSGHWCLMGRKTYEALGSKALPNRHFVILTRDNDFQSDDSVVVHSISDALQNPAFSEEEEVFVIGGGNIYQQLLPYCQTIYLTRIHASFEGDTFFYDPDPDAWVERERLTVSQDERNPYDHDFITYDRKPE